MRYATKDAIRNELLLINKMRTTTKEDVFELVENFFRKHNLQWTRLVGCTTDGATAMLGRKSGFQARVKAVFPSGRHCLPFTASYTDSLSLLNFYLLIQRQA